MRTRDEWTARLSEYIDGELEEAELRGMEAHLLECGECAATVDELRAVVAQAASLPQLPPAHDLWPGIEAQLTPRARTLAAPDARVVPLARVRRRFLFTVPQLAAAVLTAALLSASGVWAALRHAPAVEPGSAVAAAPADGRSAATAVSFTTAYDHAVADLEAEFEHRRNELDPETIIVVERNLQIIDGAIAEARRALTADPSSAFLSEHLADTMRRKMDLLRQAASI